VLQTLPLISNDFLLVSAAPRDMERDMNDRLQGGITPIIATRDYPTEASGGAEQKRSRHPSAAQLRTISSLIDQAGSKRELRRWIGLAPGRQPGRPSGTTGTSKYRDYDDDVLLIADLLQLTKGLPPVAALRHIVDPGPKRLRENLNEEKLRWTPNHGPTPNATIKRLLAKNKAFSEELAQLSQAEIDLKMDELVKWLHGLDADLQRWLVPLIIRIIQLGRSD
jgi:hypothetical protein